MTRAQQEQAVAHAAAAHVCKLFGVLLTNVTPQGAALFTNGLQNLADAERLALDAIAKETF